MGSLGLAAVRCGLGAATGLWTDVCSAIFHFPRLILVPRTFRIAPGLVSMLPGWIGIGPRGGRDASSQRDTRSFCAYAVRILCLLNKSLTVYFLGN